MAQVGPGPAGVVEVDLLLAQASPALHLGAGEIGRVSAMFAASGLCLGAMYAAGLLLSICARRSAAALVLAVFGWLPGVASACR